MAVHPLVIAELKIRVAQLDLKGIEMDVSYPEESAGAMSLRYRSHRRTAEVADGFRRLLELAEADG